MDKEESHLTYAIFTLVRDVLLQASGEPRRGPVDLYPGRVRSLASPKPGLSPGPKISDYHHQQLKNKEHLEHRQG